MPFANCYISSFQGQIKRRGPGRRSGETGDRVVDVEAAVGRGVRLLAIPARHFSLYLLIHYAFESSVKIPFTTRCLLLIVTFLLFRAGPSAVARATAQAVEVARLETDLSWWKVRYQEEKERRVAAEEGALRWAAFQAGVRSRNRVSREGNRRAT